MKFFKDFVYLGEREGERSQEGEENSPLIREPEAGLDPGTLDLLP